ncbi:Non-lysosomal glucosylceramidase [Schistosoma japonicum]|nr:Non-lysosomal glucosylceramidase [Schistosoma japonicum]
MDSQDISVLDMVKKLNIVPSYGWEARFDRKCKKKCRPFTIPRPSQIKDILGMSFRYAFQFYIKKRYIEHRLPFIDAISHVPWRPIYGVPIGGIGCGSIGRGFRGEFCRSSLIPGIYCYDIQPVDQFIVTVRKNNVIIYNQVLSPLTKPPSNGKGLRKWIWGFRPENGYYIGLYPRSWTVYEIPELQLTLVCQQISPVIPHDYQVTCLPVAIFHWKILSWSSENLKVTITFSWRGPDPHQRNKSSDSSKSLYLSENKIDHNATNSHVSTSKNSSSSYSQRSTPFSSGSNVVGCLLERTVGNELACCFGIAAKSTDRVEVSRCPGFYFHDKSLINAPIYRKRLEHNSDINGSGHSSPVSYLSYTEAPSASQFWNNLQSSVIPPDFHAIGYTVSLDCEAAIPPKLAIAVSATTTVPRCKTIGDLDPSQSELEFAVTWHSPVVKFRTGDVVYTRRYVRWFPVDGISGAKSLLNHALDNWRQWVHKIEDWQNPILSNPSLPDWYKSALFNELYYLSDGGTVWLDPIQVDCFKSDLVNCIPLDLVRGYKNGVDLDPYKLTGRKIKTPTTVTEDVKVDSWDHRARLAREMGLFAYLEGHEYRMYNTYDVHHDASWALIKLWPKLQLALNYDCADLTIAEDPTAVYYIYGGKTYSRSSECAVVHDFGDPEDEPWRCTNAYIMFPTDAWKDLNSKLILQVWRDWRITHDHQYLLYMLPIVSRILRKSLVAWDSDNDGLIENSKFPDQTYDAWVGKGLTAYTGGIWLACLYAALDMLTWCLNSDSPVYNQIVNTTDDAQRQWREVKDEIQMLFIRARNTYDSKLWTGSYYAFQTDYATRQKVIMAGQLSGYWFARVTGVPLNVVCFGKFPSKCVVMKAAFNWFVIYKINLKYKRRIFLSINSRLILHSDKY